MSLSELRDQTRTLKQNASPVVRTGGKSCEVLATLDEMQTGSEQLVLTATALFDGPFTKAGQRDTYAVRPDAVPACTENLKKGVGAAPGSVLVFGGAWRDAQSGRMSIGWINTAVSAQKQQAGMNGHDSREIREVYAQMPYLEFTNVNRRQGEPPWIRWGLTLDTARLRVERDGRWEVAEFTRDWLATKLRQAWEARTGDEVRVNHWLPVLRQDRVVPVQDLAGAREAARALMDENPHYKLIARVSDGTEVVTAYLPYKAKHTGAADYVERLFERLPGFAENGDPVVDPQTGEQILVDRYALMQGVDNTLLLQEAAAGRVLVEFLPRENLLLSSKNAPGMANDVKRILTVESNQALHQQALAFGIGRDAVSRVALVVQAQDSAVYVVGGPYRLDAGPQYELGTVPSHYLGRAAGPAPQAAPSVTAAAATAPPAGGSAKPTDAPTSKRASGKARTAAPAAVEEFPAAALEIDIDAALDAAQAGAPAPTDTRRPGAGEPGNDDPQRDPLIPPGVRKTLLENGRLSATGQEIDPPPAVKLFTPDAQATWLLTELDPRDPDIAFGLCDLGQGCPELGSVSLSEIRSARGPRGLRVERDLHFEARGTLSEYCRAARSAGGIVDLEAPSEPDPGPSKPRTPAPRL